MLNEIAGYKYVVDELRNIISQIENPYNKLCKINALNIFSEDSGCSLKFIVSEFIYELNKSEKNLMRGKFDITYLSDEKDPMDEYSKDKKIIFIGDREFLPKNLSSLYRRIKEDCSDSIILIVSESGNLPEKMNSYSFCEMIEKTILVRNPRFEDSIDFVRHIKEKITKAMPNNNVTFEVSDDDIAYMLLREPYSQDENIIYAALRFATEKLNKKVNPYENIVISRDDLIKADDGYRYGNVGIDKKEDDEYELDNVVYHEAGHAMMFQYFNETNPLHISVASIYCSSQNNAGSVTGDADKLVNIKGFSFQERKIMQKLAGFAATKITGSLQIGGSDYRCALSYAKDIAIDSANNFYINSDIHKMTGIEQEKMFKEINEILYRLFAAATSIIESNRDVLFKLHDYIIEKNNHVFHSEIMEFFKNNPMK